jgi:sigma-B regulation protein RsbU (phosphoserine phosphatase)
MVPPIALADSPDPRYRLAGLFQPARMVGGDLYDFFLLGEDRLCVVIGDVADKGIPAALLMARTVTLIRTLARQMSTPVEILNAVNHELCANNAECLFVTVLCGILNLETGRFHYASAGHDPALLIRGQEVRFLELETGPPIGLEEKAVFPQFECSLMPDDLILFYTDGITEAMNPQGELFSEGRLTAVLSGNVPADPAQTIEAIQSAYGQFVADAAQSDDLTLLALVYRGAVSRSGAAQAGECSLTIDSELIELDRVKRRLAEFFETHALAQEVIEDADLIVEELLVNIMHYGYADEAGHAIEFRVALTPVCLKITCEDRGRPFNPLTEIAAPDLTADDETRSSGGFGFYLVRQLSTHVEYLYQDGKNVLVIYRSIGRENRISCTEDEQQ